MNKPEPRVKLVKPSGLLTVVRALVAAKGLSGKSIAWSLNTKPTNVFPLLKGNGDSMVQSWESTLNGMGGELFLDPLVPGDGDRAIKVPLADVNRAQMKKRNRFFSTNAPLKYPELSEWIIFGCEQPLPKATIKMADLGACIADLAKRRQFNEDHLQILSGIAPLMAQRIIEGVEKAALTFHRKVIDLCGYKLRCECDRLTLQIERPEMPSEQEVARFHERYLKRQREYQRQPKEREASEPGNDAAKGNRATMTESQLISKLTRSDRWADVAAEAGVTRQAIFAFAKRHNILSPRQRDMSQRQGKASGAINRLVSR